MCKRRVHEINFTARLQKVCAAAEHFSTNIIYKNKREAAISSQEQDVYDPQSVAAV